MRITIAVVAAVCAAFCFVGTALITRARRVAQETGDHPETAVIRMRRARATVSVAFAESTLRPGPRAELGRLQVVRARLLPDEVAGWPGAGRRERAVFLAGREHVT